MKALVVKRRPARFAAARIASAVDAPSRAGVLLDLKDIEEPSLPGPRWIRVRPRLSGICGSDLATVDGRSSRWFEPIVSFPFVPGHEIVGDTDDGRRVVVEPVLGCAVRGVDPPCRACAQGRHDRCERLFAGHIEPGLQTGYCSDTGGGWGQVLVAHESQLHDVPSELDDAAAVMIEPVACGLHAALSAAVDGGVVAVLGAGTLGLCVIAALTEHSRPGQLVVGAKHPEQRRLARQLGATEAVSPADLSRAVRRLTGSFAYDDVTLSGGADAVYDCVGSAESIAECLAMTRPGGTVVLVGMPATVTVDLTPLWHKQIRLQGAYAYGTEPALGNRRTFEAAAELVVRRDLGRLVSASYPLDRFKEAIDHAAHAGSRGATKIVFAPQERGS